MSTAGVRTRRLYAPWVVMVVLLLSVTQIIAADAPSPTPQELVSKLQAADAANAWEKCKQYTDALTALGEAALPAIQEGLARNDKRLNGHLFGVLGGIPGDASTSLLVSAIPTDPGAVGMLENRLVRRPLSAQEFAALKALIRDEPGASAGGTARVLAHCLQVPATDRVGVILPRFLTEVASPAPAAPNRYSYVSPRVGSLNQFLLAFSYVGEAAAPFLQAAREQATDAEVRKWLVLALGMTGDRGVAGELEQIVRADADRYVRWAAVHAYARSAGADAVPLLRSLLDDRTESEYRGSCVDTGLPFYLLRVAAQDELHWLEKGPRLPK